MHPEDFEATEATKEDIIKELKRAHNSAAFRNIVSQAVVNQEGPIMGGYKRAQAIGVDIITEIDKMIND